MSMQPTPQPVPAANPRYRSTVVEEVYRDEFGRRVFTAIDWQGYRLDQGAATSEGEALRVCSRLYGAIAEDRLRHRPHLTVL